MGNHSTSKRPRRDSQAPRPHRDVVAQLGTSVLELGDQIAAYRRSVTKYIAEHPATAVGAAFGAGILLGAVARNGVLRVATVWGAERVRQGFVAAHDDAGSN